MATGTNYRLATVEDVAELAEMRWDFYRADRDEPPVHDRDEYIRVCIAFLKRGLEKGNWAYWIAERDGKIVTCMFVQRIEKVPKPNKLVDQYGYLTNVYARPEYRGQGIGSELLKHVLAWAKTSDFEFVITWPSENAVDFYRRQGFIETGEPLENPLRPYMG